MRVLGPHVPGASGTRLAHGPTFMPGSALGLWSKTLSGATADPKLVRGADDGGQAVPGCASTTA